VSRPGPQAALAGAAVALVVAAAFGLKKAADNGDLDHLDETAKRKVPATDALTYCHTPFVHHNVSSTAETVMGACNTALFNCGFK